MRAYLSDHAARPYNAADFEDDAVNAWAAMREARRILADTEASGATFTYGEHRWEGRYLKTELSRDYQRQGCAELAESLAAFIATPIE